MRAIGADAFDLDVGSRLRHEDGGPDAQLPSGEGLRQAAVAARGHDDAAVSDLAGLQSGELAIERTSCLEHAAVLKEFALDPRGVASERASTVFGRHARRFAPLLSARPFGDHHSPSIAAPNRDRASARQCGSRSASAQGVAPRA